MGTMTLTDAERLGWLRATVGSDPGAVRAIRVAAGLSNAELAAAVGVTPSCLGRWERGERIPRGPRALDYARALARLQKRAATAAQA